MRYDTIYATLAERAVDTGLVDIKAFVSRMVATGASLETSEEQMIADLMEGGPLFGKFFRNLEGAAEEAVAAAHRQGVSAGELIASDADLEKELADFDAQRALEDADPEMLEEVEMEGEHRHYMWVAELRNTCHVCMALHGKVLPQWAWEERGLEPGNVHPRCACRWVLVDHKEAYSQERAEAGVLVRNKDASGIRGGKKTIRGVTQHDVDRSLRAADAAMKTPEGRAVLRALGQTGA